ncbi:unnamed protein product [Cochlearia groenlandica]
MEKNNHASPPSLLAAVTTKDTSPNDVPIIDLSNPDKELVARAVVKASQEWGIFQVVNHNIPIDLIKRLKELGTEFYEQPEEKKQAVAKPHDSTDLEGYTTNYDKWADHLFHRIWPPSRINYNFWPKNSKDYKQVNEKYAMHVKNLCEDVMGWLSEGLGLHREALKDGMGGDTLEYLMKVIFYPPCKDLDLIYGAPPHTDLNGITFLIINGLQAYKDDTWIDVKYNDEGIIVIIADLLMRMSNGKYKSAAHRAIMDTEKTRLSWPVFAEPSLDHVVGTLPELITGEDNNGLKFKPYVYRDYKFRKMNNLPLD